MKAYYVEVSTFDSLGPVPLHSLHGSTGTFFNLRMGSYGRQKTSPSLAQMNNVKCAVKLSESTFDSLGPVPLHSLHGSTGTFFNLRMGSYGRQKTSPSLAQMNNAKCAVKLSESGLAIYVPQKIFFNTNVSQVKMIFNRVIRSN